MERARDIDEKFAVSTDGQIYKKSNGEIIPNDEPLFLLRARDRLTLPLLRIYTELSRIDGCNDYHFTKLTAGMEAFARFKSKHPERMKQPSITRGA